MDDALFGLVVKKGNITPRRININTPTVIGIFLEEAREGVKKETTFELFRKLSDIKNENLKKYIDIFRWQGVDPETIICTGENLESMLNDLGKCRSKLGRIPEICLTTSPKFDLSKIKNIIDKNRIYLVTDVKIKDGKIEKNVFCDRIIPCYPQVKATFEGKQETVGLSFFVAAQIVATDGEEVFGFADSYSNRVLNGIDDLENSVEFIPGQACEADLLRQNNITTVINYNNMFRAWGGHTLAEEKTWQSFPRVRIFDKAIKASFDGLFWSIDKRADKLKGAKDSLELFLRGLKGANVLLGFDIAWDEEKNTNESISDGKFYLNVFMQNMPIVEKFEIVFNYSDIYGQTLVNKI